MPRRIARWSLASLLAMALLPAAAQAEPEISVTIARDARLTSDGGVIISVRVRCPQLPGSEDFREGRAGAGQPRTGAGAEGGLDGTVVCDGVERTHTARLFPHTGTFRRGPANANASVIACNVVGDDQVCATGSHRRRILIKGPTVP